MLLAIDAGNTNIVFAVFDNKGKICGEWRSSTHMNRTADEYGVWLERLFELAGLSRSSIDGAIIASVVPNVVFTLKSLCQKYFDCNPMIVGDDGFKLGIEVLIDHPDEVGADRVVNAVSAFDKYGGPLIVVDFGTATTFDVIDEFGNYCGGAIAPGINLSLEALHMASAKLPRIAVARPSRVIGKSTVQAMQSGVFWGYIGLIEGMINQIQDELNSKVEAIATGGLADLFIDPIHSLKHVDTHLTLRGLYALFLRNTENKDYR